MKYKTAFYSFYLPVAAAMYIVSITNLRMDNRVTLDSSGKFKFPELLKMLE